MELTHGHIRAVARAAYIFTYPLVMSYADLYTQAIDPCSPFYSGGCGTWRQPNRGWPTPDDRFHDGPYSVAWLDLRAEPWVVRLPDSYVGRSPSTRIADLWGFTAEDSAPSTSRSSGEVLVLLASSSWLGDIRDDVDRIVRGESSFLRLVMTSPDGRHEDLPALEPMSAHRGRNPARQAPPLDWVPWRPGDETTNHFWSCASFALSLTERHSDDEPVLHRIADIGVVPGEPWDPAWFDVGTLEAISCGVDDALSDLLEAAKGSTPPAHAGLSRRGMDGDYFGRALSALRDPSLIGVEASGPDDGPSGGLVGW